LYVDMLAPMVKGYISYIVATGWISVNMNDHDINSQPRNTESSAVVSELPFSVPSI